MDDKPNSAPQVAALAWLTDSWVQPNLTGNAVSAAGSLGRTLYLPRLRILLPDVPVATDIPRHPVAHSSSQQQSGSKARTEQCFKRGAHLRRCPPLPSRICNVAGVHVDGRKVKHETRVSLCAVHRVGNVLEEIKP